MSLMVRVESFEGPLDLLLKLVEKNERDLSTISLAAVADQFVKHLQSHPEISLEDTADFLVIATKLLYLKSKLLLPALVIEELEEDSSLEEQLRQYRAFLDTTTHINILWNSQERSFARTRIPRRICKGQFLPPEGITLKQLWEHMQHLIARLELITRLPNAAVQRVVTLQEKISMLFSRIREIVSTSFQSLVGARASKTDLIVSFLAILELTKQRYVHVNQHALFQEIMIQRHMEAPLHDPCAHLFV